VNSIELCVGVPSTSGCGCRCFTQQEEIDHFCVIPRHLEYGLDDLESAAAVDTIVLRDNATLDAAAIPLPIRRVTFGFAGENDTQSFLSLADNATVYFSETRVPKPSESFCTELALDELHSGRIEAATGNIDGALVHLDTACALKSNEEEDAKVADVSAIACTSAQYLRKGLDMYGVRQNSVEPLAYAGYSDVVETLVDLVDAYESRIETIDGMLDARRNLAANLATVGGQLGLSLEALSGLVNETSTQVMKHIDDAAGRIVDEITARLDDLEDNLADEIITSREQLQQSMDSVEGHIISVGNLVSTVRSEIMEFREEHEKSTQLILARVDKAITLIEENGRVLRSIHSVVLANAAKLDTMLILQEEALQSLQRIETSMNDLAQNLGEGQGFWDFNQDDVVDTDEMFAMAEFEGLTSPLSAVVGDVLVREFPPAQRKRVSINDACIDCTHPSLAAVESVATEVAKEVVEKFVAGVLADVFGDTLTSFSGDDECNAIPFSVMKTQVKAFYFSLMADATASPGRTLSDLDACFVEAAQPLFGDEFCVGDVRLKDNVAALQRIPFKPFPFFTVDRTIHWTETFDGIRDENQVRRVLEAAHRSRQIQVKGGLTLFLREYIPMVVCQLTSAFSASKNLLFGEPVLNNAIDDDAREWAREHAPAVWQRVQAVAATGTCNGSPDSCTSLGGPICQLSDVDRDGELCLVPDAVLMPFTSTLRLWGSLIETVCDATDKRTAPQKRISLGGVTKALGLDRAAEAGKNLLGASVSGVRRLWTEGGKLVDGALDGIGSVWDKLTAEVKREILDRLSDCLQRVSLGKRQTADMEEFVTLIDRARQLGQFSDAVIDHSQEVEDGIAAGNDADYQALVLSQEQLSNVQAYLTETYGEDQSSILTLAVNSYGTWATESFTGNVMAIEEDIIDEEWDRLDAFMLSGSWPASASDAQLFRLRRVLHLEQRRATGLALDYMIRQERQFRYWALGPQRSFSIRSTSIATSLRQELAASKAAYVETANAIESSSDTRVTGAWVRFTVDRNTFGEAYQGFARSGTISLNLLMPNNTHFYRVVVRDVRAFVITPQFLYESDEDELVSLTVEKGPSSVFRDGSGDSHTFVHRPLPTSFSYSPLQDCKPASSESRWQNDEFIQYSPYGLWKIGLESGPLNASQLDMAGAQFIIEFKLNWFEHPDTNGRMFLGDTLDEQASPDTRVRRIVEDDFAGDCNNPFGESNVVYVIELCVAESLVGNATAVQDVVAAFAELAVLPAIAVQQVVVDLSNACLTLTIQSVPGISASAITAALRGQAATDTAPFVAMNLQSMEINGERFDFSVEDSSPVEMRIQEDSISGETIGIIAGSVCGVFLLVAGIIGLVASRRQTSTEGANEDVKLERL